MKNRRPDAQSTIEGIEQPEQVGSLRDLNCRLGQGFYEGPPSSPGSPWRTVR